MGLDQDLRRYRLGENITAPPPDTIDDLLDRLRDGQVDLDHAAAAAGRLVEGGTA